MKKEKLKRLKALLLAGTMCLTLNGCGKDNEETDIKEEEQTEAAVFFLEGKAIIYSGDYQVLIKTGVSTIGDSVVLDENVAIFSTPIEAVKVKSKEDAYELAEAVVGDENIIYIDYIAMHKV
mgnify:CR=1 FL=1